MTIRAWLLEELKEPRSRRELFSKAWDAERNLCSVENELRRMVRDGVIEKETRLGLRLCV